MGTRDPRVDDYSAKAADFARPVLAHLREVVHAACPDVQESIKWGFPHFMHGGRILAGMAAFKAHCAFGFWHGDAVAGSGRGGEAMGQFGRITSVKDLPSKRELTSAVKKAAALIDAGIKPVRAPKTAEKPPPVPSDDLASALARNPAARKTFDSFPPSQQREYVDWIAEAKRKETRERRLSDAVDWLAKGLRRNWKYENC
jgi:uncharacterized protein YdeI (YjbR/CyaY-like superfamily)